MTATVKSRYITAVKWLTAILCAVLFAVAVCCFASTRAEAASISSCRVSSISSYTYTGSAIKPAPTVKYGSKTLKAGTDYTLSYKNNINAGTAYVTITGKGSYSGSVRKSFTIKPAVIYKACTFYKIATQYYTGSVLKPVPKIVNGKTALVNGKDFSLSYANNINKGTATVYITGKGNYSGRCSLKFTITARSVSTLSISIASQYYTGKALTPAPTVKYGSISYTKDKDYTVTYKNNVSIGTATAVITGKNRLSGKRTVTFKINPMPLSKATLSCASSLTYTGSALTPAVTVKYGTATLKKGTDYTVSYYNNKNAGNATVVVIGKGNYSGTVVRSFTIKKATITDSSVSAISAQQFTGSAIKPLPAVKVGTRTLAVNTDYTLSYTDNTVIGTASVTVTGKGNYTGSIKRNFNITARDISSAAFSLPTAETYTGSEITPEISVSYGSYEFLSGTDYTVAFSNNLNAGTATVIVTGKGTLSGSKTVSFTIEPADISSGMSIGVRNTVYTGFAQSPETIVKFGGVKLTENTDYTLLFSDNINAGKGTVTISGKGNFKGTTTRTFTVNKADFSAVTLTASGIFAPGGVNLTVNAKLGDYTLCKDDYTLTVPEHSGTYSLTVNGAKNFSGSKTVSCTVAKADLSSAKVTVTKNTGSSDFTVSVILDGTELIRDTDYTAEISETSSDITAVITGKGDYTGTVTATSVIDYTADFMNAEITVSNVTYNTSAQLPPVTVKINGTTLVSGTDYVLSATNNINAGTATAVLTGKGKYAGASRSVSFEILPAQISSASISCADQVYTGMGIAPIPTITYKGKTLTVGTDFYMSGYSNIVNIGTASFTVKGKGNFTGTATGTFRIISADSMESLVKQRLDEMMEGLWDRKINDYMHSYKLSNYYNTNLTSPCTCHSYCETGYESGCTCLIGRSNVLNNSGIQCCGFTLEVFEYLFGKTNGTGENTLTIKNRSDGNWTEEALKKWMTDTFRPGDYLAYDNIMYGYPHYVTIYSVDTDGIWVYEANYGGRCKINFRKFTFKEIYEQTDGLWHRTPNNYELSQY